MKYSGYLFTDVVSGKDVNEYIDCFGQYWMANNSYNLFRVKKEK